MEYLIGVALGLVVAGLAAATGMHRDRSFAPVILIVVAFYYVLFAVMGAPTRTLVTEILVAIGFSSVAVAGIRGKQWLAPAGIVAHGLFDLTHHLWIDNPSMPIWWPGFCMAIDVVMGAALVLLLMRRSHSTPSANSASEQ